MTQTTLPQTLARRDGERMPTRPLILSLEFILSVAEGKGMSGHHLVIPVPHTADPKRGVPTVIVNGAHPFCHSERSEESRASACKAAIALDEPSGFFAEFILSAAEGLRMTSSMGLGHKLCKGHHGRRGASLGSQNARLHILNFAPIRHTRANPQRHSHAHTVVPAQAGTQGRSGGPQQSGQKSPHPCQTCPEHRRRDGSDSFPIFLIFWAPFSLAALYIMLKRIPFSDTTKTPFSTQKRHFWQ